MLVYLIPCMRLVLTDFLVTRYKIVFIFNEASNELNNGTIEMWWRRKKNYAGERGKWSRDEIVYKKGAKQRCASYICVSMFAVMILPQVNRYQSIYKIETDRYRIHVSVSIWCAYRVILVMLLQLYIGELDCSCSFVRSLVRLNRTSVQRNQNEYRNLLHVRVSVLLNWSHLPLLFSLMFLFFIILIQFCSVLVRVCFNLFFAPVLWTHKCNHIIM